MLGENLKLLRKRKELSQEDIAKMLDISRSSYSGYENEASQPPIEILLKLSATFKISLDILLGKALSQFTEQQFRELENQTDTLSGQNLRVLVVATDNQQEDVIELIPESAKAGYSLGYADPEFIRVLPAFNLPFLSKQKKCRAFPVSGDSMPPVSHGSFVIGEYLDNWHLIRDGFPYIVVTKNEGIVFKIVYNLIDEKQVLQLCSTNPLYPPFEIATDEILEVWRFVNYICSEFENTKPDDALLTRSIRDLQKEVADLKSVILSR
jgi:transcriptional regulator with XRE-family HTH domain